MKAVLFGNMIYNIFPILQEKLRTVCELTRFREDADKEVIRQEVKNAHAIVTMTYDERFKGSESLKLIQVPGIGLDKINFNKVLPDTSVCVAYGHEVAVSEYVILAILNNCHQFMNIAENFRKINWHFSSRTGGPLHEEVLGKTIGIIGMGRIGQAVAIRAKSLGMKVIACNRSAINHNAVDQFFAFHQLDVLLSKSNFVVVCCALAPETKDLINAKSFDKMDPASVLINVARGECINEKDLYEACSKNKISGAIIDTWYQYPSLENPYPLPSRYPFHLLPNVVMTPHSSAWTKEMLNRRIDTIAENLLRLAQRKPLLNLVTKPL